MSSAAASAPAATTMSVRPTTSAAPSVPVVDSLVPFDDTRKVETAAYSLRHYGDDTWRLTPSMVVLHYSGGGSWEGVRDTFAPDVANLGEKPNTCAHFVVDQDGTVHALVPVTIRCRHTIGLNDRAIGIEVVQPALPDPRAADAAILARRPQVTALAALVRMLQARYGIPADAVIGHAMANDDPRFHDLLGWRNDHVDWQEPDVVAFRRLLSVAAAPG
ncbi:N-acetylmuramoyl-L-alanine amidase [Lapillicoccus jejuensis]|uniref:N-acetylmuramoyl-L-alanine amidase n=1 Tax=Lapillicoccus jejuensis TaxID=402171 RepID=A0A542E1D2_9MICO|nr:N-acetylmuramoyl-L-alanine amidase [Lapillicoccus jejuensis]